MFIPNYQIHNILKDFAQQLKKTRLQNASPPTLPTTSPGPTRTPDNLRLSSVVNKVADNIMDRIAGLGRENDPTAGSEAKRSVPAGAADCRQHPPVFDYHLMDRERGKVKQQLVVEDSHNLVSRFQNLTDVGGRGGKDAP
jgi:hypothetical protein